MRLNGKLDPAQQAPRSGPVPAPSCSPHPFRSSLKCHLPTSLHCITQACAHTCVLTHPHLVTALRMVASDGQAGSETQSPPPLPGSSPVGRSPRGRELSWAHRLSCVLTQRTSVQDLDSVPLLICIINLISSCTKPPLFFLLIIILYGLYLFPLAYL